MKGLGITRKIDELGRLVIPIEVRRSQGWEERQPVEMFMGENGELIVKAFQDENKHADLLEKLSKQIEQTPDQETKLLLEELAAELKK